MDLSSRQKVQVSSQISCQRRRRERGSSPDLLTSPVAHSPLMYAVTGRRILTRSSFHVRGGQILECLPKIEQAKLKGI